MRGEQAIFNLEIKKKRGLSINPDIHHSKVFSSELATIGYFKSYSLDLFVSVFPLRYDFIKLICRLTKDLDEALISISTISEVPSSSNSKTA